ncbi:hypothetical protein HanPI659440_Chr13g0522581 [Helianthus annuus]|nr:hypothetical protein HanPI659440_Chr13g0522581 [Helianthus annuus]
MMRILWIDFVGHRHLLTRFPLCIYQITRRIHPLAIIAGPTGRDMVVVGLIS